LDARVSFVVAIPRPATLLLLTVLVLDATAAGVPEEAGLQFFREKIQPVLEANCFECHSATATKIKGGLQLDSREASRRGGDTGPAVAPGNPGKSLLIQAIRHEGDLQMPPKKPKLSDAVIADFVRWVELGAPDLREAETTASSPYDFKKAREFWAFQPVKRTDPPAVKDKRWVKTPLDQFVLAKVEANGLRPAPPASKAELIRRVYFDLTGLPPSPEEIKAFTEDRSPKAYEHLVDRLLDSPHFGERSAQFWLDVVRYAETEGFEYDRHLPDAWRYRDYVINAFNRDKPFDQFLTEQIAGDEIAPDDPEKQSATVFHRLGPVRRNAGNPEIALSRNEILTERTDAIGAAFLGLTVGCARCHDHKFDPIPQRDYYRLQAYLAGTQEYDLLLVPSEEKKAWEQQSLGINNEIKRLRRALEKAEGAEREKVEKEIEEQEAKLPPSPPTIPGIHNIAEQRTEMHVLKRGVWENKGEAVAPRPLSVLVSDALLELPADLPKPRTELARWLTDPKNPLTPRVAVNRIWQQHFGLGLVKTPNDFGANGDRPSHPELLDWLASDLIKSGWKLKPLHRMILLSSAYQQSSRSPMAVAAIKLDPENRWLWQFNRRRLSAEEIRDAMLVLSGRLNLKEGGRSVMVPVDKELVRQLYKPTQWEVARDTTEHDRRSIYMIAKRNLRVPFMEVFDAPALLTSCPARESSTHAPQALELLNGKLSNELAEAFARRLQHDAGGDREKMIERACSLALGRPPTREERDLSLAYLRDGSPREFALAVFNLNAFLYVQ
jgi:mono/diheme cytochrome c family protein